jgi:hypothetical protein
MHQKVFKVIRDRARLLVFALCLLPLAFCLHWAGGSTAGVAVLASGRFHQVAHKGRGRAVIYELPGRKRLLALTEFATAPGADLQVLLVRVPDAYENESVELAEPVALGDLLSNEGDQTYVVPDGVDLTVYRAVTIWNRKYRVNFATAPLAPR